MTEDMPTVGLSGRPRMSAVLRGRDRGDAARLAGRRVTTVITVVVGFAALRVARNTPKTTKREKNSLSPLPP
ncbi:MAG: hypothetical protein ACR2FQ_09710, partial [Pseudonocardiaceae bacterium]